MPIYCVNLCLSIHSTVRWGNWIKRSAAMAGSIRLEMFYSQARGNESFCIPLLRKAAKDRSLPFICHQKQLSLPSSIIQRNGCVGESRSFGWYVPGLFVLRAWRGLVLCWTTNYDALSAYWFPGWTVFLSGHLLLMRNCWRNSFHYGLDTTSSNCACIWLNQSTRCTVMALSWVIYIQAMW